MMYRWEPQMIYYMTAASKNTLYNKKIARFISDNSRFHGSVCEGGCGLGFLSLELSSYFSSVTAVDINKNALEVLKENAKANITIQNSDINILDNNARFDTMVFCYFGNCEQIIKTAENNCKHDLFIITRQNSLHNFDLSSTKTLHNAHSTVTYLDKYGIKYTKTDMSIDFGQPLKSIDEAREFFSLYNRSNTMPDDNEIISRLIQTDSKQYPLYVPLDKKISIFSIRLDKI